MPTAEELGVVNVLEVVQSIFDIEGKERGDEYDINCPNPQHIDSHPSCSINLKTGLWHCFSCSSSGDLLHLGHLVTGRSKEDIAEMLKPRSTEALIANVRRKLEQALPKRRSKASVRPSSELGPYSSGPLGSIRRRGFSQHTLKRWGVRFADEETLLNKEGNPFTIKSSIAIPIRDEHNRLLTWCYRRTDSSPSWQPRYLYPTDAALSEIWFGLQHHSQAQHITIVEGALDAMWLDQCGYPALALLGASMGDRKIMWLQRYKSVTILGDRDAGGIAAVERIGKMLGNRLSVKVGRYPLWMGDDPQELSGVDVEIIHERAVTWTSYKMNQEGH